MRVRNIIWIIAPRPDEYSMLAAMLLEEQIETHYPTSYHEAIRLLAREIPDAVLVDPGNNNLAAFEFSHQLKTTAIIREIPVIFLSDSDDDELENDAFDSGADDFIRKPLRLKPLISRL